MMCEIACMIDRLLVGGYGDANKVKGDLEREFDRERWKSTDVDGSCKHKALIFLLLTPA